MQQLPSLSTLDNTLIAELYNRYWLTILIAIRQHIPSREEAEDILLEVFLAALESDIFPHLEEKQQYAWLRRAAYNKAMDSLRRSHRHPHVVLEDAAETLYAADEQTPEQTALRREEYALLQTHMAELSEVQQQVLRLRFGKDLRCSEIATQMHKSEGAIRVLLSRTLNFLRNTYTQKSGGNF
jgi:RNA polymerase sigma factor (sigma-70 family)